MAGNWKLKLARMKLNLRQIDVARAVGISENSVSAWETGRAAPLPEMQRKVAKVLKMKAEHLFGSGTEGSQGK